MAAQERNCAPEQPEPLEPEGLLYPQPPPEPIDDPGDRADDRVPAPTKGTISWDERQRALRERAR